ncbi:MAG: hypothetical protein ACI32Y_04210 [Clostridium sp.]
MIFYISDLNIGDILENNPSFMGDADNPIYLKNKMNLEETGLSCSYL